MASGSGARVILEDGATISGGTLKTSGAGASIESDEIGPTPNAINSARIAANTLVISDEGVLVMNRDVMSGGAILEADGAQIIVSGGTFLAATKFEAVSVGIVVLRAISGSGGTAVASDGGTVDILSGSWCVAESCSGSEQAQRSLTPTFPVAAW